MSNISGNYKSLDFGVFFQGSQGNEIYNVTRYYNIFWADDNKLSEIKNAYKNNIFNVLLQTEDTTNKVSEKISEKFNVLSSNPNVEEGNWSISIQLPSADTRGVLKELSEYGNVSRFEEVIPSANDIFIQTVNGKEGHG